MRPVIGAVRTSALTLGLTPALTLTLLLAGCTAGTAGVKMVQVPPPQTRAERSNYTETSRYGDVIAFLNTLQARHAPLAFGSIGTSTQGRRIPYVVASRPMVATPAEARRLGRPIVYVNANIHGGEIEGKEAMLAMLRDLTYGARPNVLDSVVLIVVPIYNTDGNDQIAPQAVNRTEQNGPELVGQRPNGQGLDLNRDYVKAEAPETRGSLAMFTAWDPDVYVDLHTTDGSYHGYSLTYAPSLAPTAYDSPSSPSTFSRDVLLPELRRRMRERARLETFDYGNFDEEAPLTDTVKQGWYTYDSRPRFGTNYYGLRGRIGILSEAYSHDPLRQRVSATYAFVRELLSLTAERSARIMALSDRARGAVPQRVAIRSELTRAPYVAPVTFEVLRRTGDSTRTQPGVPPGIRRTGRYITQRMNVYDRFTPTVQVTPPPAYIIPPRDTAAVATLRLHGVVVDTLRDAGTIAVERFMIDSIATAARPFQGHRETRITGRWIRGDAQPQRGSYVVRTSQPLGTLAAYMLEPESEDGLTDWNFFDPSLSRSGTFPVLRATQAVPR